MLYTLAAQINGNEYLLTTPSFDIIVYPDLQKAKDLFQLLYHPLTNEKPESKLFQRSLYILLHTQPSILHFNLLQNKLSAAILSWTNKKASVRSSVPVIPIPHVLIPMRQGFIKKHQVLNIQKDIESTPRIGIDGQITYNSFNLNPTGEKNPQERAMEVLKQKGLV